MPKLIHQILTKHLQEYKLKAKGFLGAILSLQLLPFKFLSLYAASPYAAFVEI